MGQQNQKQQNPVKEEENGDSTGGQQLKGVRRRRLPLELECEVFKFLQLPFQHKFIWGMGRGIYGMFGQKILDKTKRLANPKGNGWDRRKSPRVKISSNGLIVSDDAMNTKWHYIFAEKGFVISEAKSLNANFPREILYYFEVTQTTTQCAFYDVGLSHGAIPADTTYPWESTEFYTYSHGSDYAYDYCWLAKKHHPFQRPNGDIKPEWIHGPGNVLGCGLLLNPENKLFIFFTGNGTLMGKPIPISPSVDCLFPTVWVLSSSLEAHFGNNLAEKPFKFDHNKCPGFDFEPKLLRGLHTMKTVRNALAQLAPLVDGIRKSYGQRTEMRIEMAAPLMEIAQYYRMFKQSEKGIEACNEVIDALGPLLKYTYIPDVYLRKAQIYSHGMDNHSMAKDSALKAYEFFQHKIGPMDKELFVQFYRFFWPFLFT